MRSNVNIVLAFSLVAITLGYGIFDARALMRGPVVMVTHPQPGEKLTDVLLTIEGHAENVTQVRVNGRTIALDPTGAFSEKLVTPKGYGTVLVEAENRFGQHTREVVEFVGQPDAL
jgi:hypothetical protein